MKKATTHKAVRIARARLLTLATQHGQAMEATKTFAKLEALERAGAPNPFDLVTPTRNNFSNIRAAITYYKARLAVCNKADAMLSQGSALVDRVVQATEKMLDGLSKLTAQDLATLQVPKSLQPDELQKYLANVRPMIGVFSDSAQAYAKQGALLQQTIDALEAGARGGKRT